MFVTKAQDTKGLPFLNVSLMQFQNGSSLSDIATPYSIIRTNLSSGDDGPPGPYDIWGILGRNGVWR